MVGPSPFPWNGFHAFATPRPSSEVGSNSRGAVMASTGPRLTRTFPFPGCWACPIEIAERHLPIGTALDLTRCRRAAALGIALVACQADVSKRSVSNQSAVIAQIQAVRRRLECHRERARTFPTRMVDLDADGMNGCGEEGPLQAAVQSIITTNSASGYVYAYHRTDSGDGFEISAAPSELGKTGRRFFWMDQLGVVHERAGAPAGRTDPLISSP
jgi:hypothetical protein